jgi:hypothetical protein
VAGGQLEHHLDRGGGERAVRAELHHLAARDHRGAEGLAERHGGPAANACTRPAASARFAPSSAARATGRRRRRDELGVALAGG